MALSLLGGLWGSRIQPLWPIFLVKIKNNKKNRAIMYRALNRSEQGCLTHITDLNRFFLIKNILNFSFTSYLIQRLSKSAKFIFKSNTPVYTVLNIAFIGSGQTDGLFDNIVILVAKPNKCWGWNRNRENVIAGALLNCHLKQISASNRPSVIEYLIFLPYGLRVLISPLMCKTEKQLLVK